MKKTMSKKRDSRGQKEILCTLGPSSMNDRVIARLEDLGVNLFRVNLSHTRIDDLRGVIDFIKSRTSVPVCLDTEGAQIRTGVFADKELLLEDNAVVRVLKKPAAGGVKGFNLYPLDIVDRLEAGDFISIDFNSALAQVIDRDRDGVLVRVLTGGLVGQNKAVSVERDIKLPALTDKDRKAMKIGAGMGIDHVALSFANEASDVDEIRSLFDKEIFVISKIESLKGLSNLEDIASCSNALLIDRGDLSRQIPIENIPRAQKDIIRRAKACGVKVYVATNLLESMVKSFNPTRAEVNDVFNTLADGADGLVLAAETAIGQYPINCATMVRKIMRQFEGQKKACSVENLRQKDSFLLAEPHGGTLVDRTRYDFDIKEIKRYKCLDVGVNVLLDAEQIAIGTFSPLEGFMNRRELDSVLRAYRLPKGAVWPIPITLQVDKRDAARFKEGDKAALVFKGEVYAVLEVEDIYRYDLDKMAKETFMTNDADHPGVRALKGKGDYFLGGKVTLFRRLGSPYKYFELTPGEARAIFENKGWSRVVGFHTRNVIHRVHEHIQMLAFEKYNCDGIFVHPIVGPKKEGDYGAGIILKSYDLMAREYYPKGKVVMAAFQNYSRYSGPREAVFTALCRKNFGCGYFIVGRDHTGVGGYYRHDDAHRLFDRLGDIGITPIFFNKMHYCRKCGAYVERCGHGGKDTLDISGTEARKILQAGRRPPEWFMRREISELVLSEMGKGAEVFLK
ncbi:MAG: sulfate adenylyltransferase [Candidatus Omnitrophota bacterium]